MSPRVLVVGGFLGAGKTTAIARLARLLQDRGERVGVVTNDQSSHLVDTAFLAQHGLDVGEVCGACFCCDLRGLERELASLARATVVLAEPVGSCTDLVATVVKPLAAKGFHVGPLSVLVAPERLREARPDAVGFLVEHQLAEADVVVLTKRDACDPREHDALLAELRARVPDRPVLTASAHDDASLRAWLACVERTPRAHRTLRGLDYGEYARAEAELGWVNAELVVDGAVDLAKSVGDIERAVRDAGGVVGNVKVLANGVKASASGAGVDVVSAAHSHAGALEYESARPVRVNARASIPPDDLVRIVRASFAGARVERVDAFRPKPPVPTERLE